VGSACLRLRWSGEQTGIQEADLNKRDIPENEGSMYAKMI
jgi:hypothetical protein